MLYLFLAVLVGWVVIRIVFTVAGGLILEGVLVAGSVTVLVVLCFLVKAAFSNAGSGPAKKSAAEQWEEWEQERKKRRDDSAGIDA